MQTNKQKKTEKALEPERKNYLTQMGWKPLRFIAAQQGKHHIIGPGLQSSHGP